MGTERPTVATPWASETDIGGWRTNEPGSGPLDRRDARTAPGRPRASGRTPPRSEPGRPGRPARWGNVRRAGAPGQVEARRSRRSIPWTARGEVPPPGPAARWRRTEAGSATAHARR